MATIVYSTDFSEQTDLFDDINAKNTADGKTSVIITYLNQQGIDLVADAAASKAAQNHETNRITLTKQSQNNTQLRDINFDPVFKHVTGCYQFLKTLFKPNYKALGDWGATITDNGKIIYPPSFNERVDLFDSLKKQHDSFAPGTSPLQPYLDQNGIDLGNDKANVKIATDNDTEGVQASKDAENETQQRDIKWKPVLAHVKGIGEYLMKLYTGNEKQLGLWGFVVDNSPRKEVTRKSILKIGNKITIKGIVLGSVLTNTGTVDINISKGSKESATPTVLSAGKAFGIQRGYGTVTVKNTSTLVSASFTVIVKG